MGKIMILKQGGAGVTQFQSVGEGAPKASALWNTMRGKTGASRGAKVRAGLGLGGKALAAGLAAQSAGTRMQAGNSLRPLTQVGLDYEATDPTAQMQRVGIVPQNKQMETPVAPPAAGPTGPPPAAGPTGPPPAAGPADVPFVPLPKEDVPLPPPLTAQQPAAAAMPPAATPAAPPVAAPPGTNFNMDALNKPPAAPPVAAPAALPDETQMVQWLEKNPQSELWNMNLKDKGAMTNWMTNNPDSMSQMGFTMPPAQPQTAATPATPPAPARPYTGPANLNASSPNIVRVKQAGMTGPPPSAAQQANQRDITAMTQQGGGAGLFNQPEWAREGQDQLNMMPFNPNNTQQPNIEGLPSPISQTPAFQGQLNTQSPPIEPTFEERLNALRPQAAQAAQPAQPLTGQPLQPAQPTNPNNDAAMYQKLREMNKQPNLYGAPAPGEPGMGSTNANTPFGMGSSNIRTSEMTLANVFAINAMHILGDGIFAKSPESVGFACANMYLKSR